MKNPVLETRGSPEIDQATNFTTPDYALEALRKQFLAEIFGLPAATAVTAAERCLRGGSEQ